MAIDDDAVLTLGTGHYYTAPTGTALPSDLSSVTTPWTEIGHTSLDDIFGVSSDGGDATVLGTLQNKSLRTVYAARTEKLSFTVMQFDTASLKLFFGSNAPELPNGLVGVPTDPQPTVCAFLVVFTDGDNRFAFYAPKTEIYRGDDMSVSDADALAGMPLAVTPIAYSTNNWVYAVTPLDPIIAATGATAGTPGTWTPDGATAPADLTTLQNGGITASPTSAWTTGQYVTLGDSSQAHWDGDSWESGAVA